MKEKTNSGSKFGIIVLLALILASSFLASTPTSVTQISDLMKLICTLLTNILPILAFLLLVLAAILYGGSELFDSETKAKMKKWSTACLVSVIIVLILYLIGPLIVSALTGNEFCTLCDCEPPSVTCPAGLSSCSQLGCGPQLQCPSGCCTDKCECAFPIQQDGEFVWTVCNSTKCPTGCCDELRCVFNGRCCLPSGESCQNAEDCCSSFCNIATGACECKDYGAACIQNEECCGFISATPTAACKSIDAGESVCCNTNCPNNPECQTDCCNAQCQVIKQSQECKSAFQSCNSDTDCCSGNGKTCKSVPPSSTKICCYECRPGVVADCCDENGNPQNPDCPKQCTDTGCKTACDTNGECPTGQECCANSAACKTCNQANGKCGSNGLSCTTDSDCTSAICSGGSCCPGGSAWDESAQCCWSSANNCCMGANGECVSCESDSIQSCTVSDGCAGTRKCILGTWSDCEKTDPVCVGYTCPIDGMSDCGNNQVACKLINGEKECYLGACQTGGTNCPAGYSDCDNSASNGCECNTAGGSYYCCGGECKAVQKPLVNPPLPEGSYWDSGMGIFRSVADGSPVNPPGTEWSPDRGTYVDQNTGQPINLCPTGWSDCNSDSICECNTASSHSCCQGKCVVGECGCSGFDCSLCQICIDRLCGGVGPRECITNGDCLGSTCTDGKCYGGANIVPITNCATREADDGQQCDELSCCTEGLICYKTNPLDPFGHCCKSGWTCYI